MGGRTAQKGPNMSQRSGLEAWRDGASGGPRWSAKELIFRTTSTVQAGRLSMGGGIGKKKVLNLLGRKTGARDQPKSRMAVTKRPQN